MSKSYRIKEIDDKIRRMRTKSEAKLISDIKSCGVKSPVLYDVNLDDKSILMEEVHGNLLKNVMDDLSADERFNLAKVIGHNIGLMHNNDIIHGDITSSNMIIDDNGDFVFIDFGLGGYSDLIEDKATDLLVLKKSFQSIDYDIASETFEWIIDGYINTYSDDLSKNEIKNKIKDIESRGRYTH